VDSAKVGIFFSPTDVVNDDIISSFANLDFNDLIGDPRDVFSESYRTLKNASDKYFKKYTGNNSFFEYISLIKNYDQNIFKQLKKVIPARAKTTLGTVIESNILERPKSPIQRNNPSVEQIDFRDNINVSVMEHENEASSSALSLTTEFSDLIGNVNSDLQEPSLYKFASNFNYTDEPLRYINATTRYGGPDKVFQEISGSVIVDNRQSLFNKEFRFFYTSSADYDDSNIYSTDKLLNLYNSSSLVHTDLDTNYEESTALNNTMYEGVKNTSNTTIDGGQPVVIRREAPTVAVPIDGVVSDLKVVDD